MQSALLLKLDERRSPGDIRLLERCWSWKDVDGITPPVTAHQLAWFLHFRLLVTRIDRLDCVLVETTQLGRDLVRYIRKKPVAKVAS